MEQSQDIRGLDQEGRNALLKPLKLFALAGSEDLGASIAANLGLRLAAHEERDFEDGEHKCRPLESVAGADVYTIDSLYGGPIQSPNDKLCRLLFFIGTLRDAGAPRDRRGAIPLLLSKGPPDKESRSRAIFMFNGLKLKYCSRHLGFLMVLCACS